MEKNTQKEKIGRGGTRQGLIPSTNNIDTMKTEAISKTIEKIDNNFFAQKICANKIEDLRDMLKNKGSIWYFIYSEKDIKEKIKSQIKLLRRLKSMNAANISKLAELNKTR